MSVEGNERKRRRLAASVATDRLFAMPPDEKNENNHEESHELRNVALHPELSAEPAKRAATGPSGFHGLSELNELHGLDQEFDESAEAEDGDEEYRHMEEAEEDTQDELSDDADLYEEEDGPFVRPVDSATPELPEACVFCREKLPPQLRKLSSHICKHIENAMPLNACTLCGKAFKWSAGLKRHLRNSHPPEYAVEVDRPRMETFLMAPEMQRQWRAVLNSNSAGKVSEFAHRTLFPHARRQQELLLAQIAAGEGVFAGRQGAPSEQKSRRVTPPTTTRATTTTATAATATATTRATSATTTTLPQKRHRLTNAQKQCPWCSQHATNVWTMASHILSGHFGLAQFRCRDCKKVFKWRSDLTKHAKKSHRANESAARDFVVDILGDRRSEWNRVMLSCDKARIQQHVDAVVRPLIEGRTPALPQTVSPSEESESVAVSPSGSVAPSGSLVSEHVATGSVTVPPSVTPATSATSLPPPNPDSVVCPHPGCGHRSSVIGKRSVTLIEKHYFSLHVQAPRYRCVTCARTFSLRRKAQKHCTEMGHDDFVELLDAEESLRLTECFRMQDLEGISNLVDTMQQRQQHFEQHEQQRPPAPPAELPELPDESVSNQETPVSPDIAPFDATQVAPSPTPDNIAAHLRELSNAYCDVDDREIVQVAMAVLGTPVTPNMQVLADSTSQERRFVPLEFAVAVAARACRVPESRVHAALARLRL